MKILIIDDNASAKCRGITEYCRLRGLEVQTEFSVNTAIKEIEQNKNSYLAIIILHMALPWDNCEFKMNARGGEEILRRMSQKEILDIPVLFYSPKELKSNYLQVKATMKDWIKDQLTYLKFMQELQIARIMKGDSF